MPATGEIYNPWRVFVGSFIPNAVLRCRELSSTSKLVFGRLCQYAGENGQSYPTYRTLGHEVGIDRRQAIRAVKELEKFGLIQPCGRLRLDGGSTSNIYIFLWHRILAGESSPSVKNDAGGECHKCHPPGCHERHQGVSNMTPRKKQTREKTSKETTTEQLQLLLSGTPLSEITDEGIRILTNRHGIERLSLVADIAAETWRRERRAIRNPGGYLNTLCNSHVVPDWYVSLEERRARLKEAEEQERQIARAVEEKRTNEEKEALAREEYWLSLSEPERDEFRRAVIATLPPGFDLLSQTEDNIARSRAWQERSQMSTNGLPQPFECGHENPSNQEIEVFE
jgi:hypothetical protein